METKEINASVGSLETFIKMSELDYQPIRVLSEVLLLIEDWDTWCWCLYEIKRMRYRREFSGNVPSGNRFCIFE